MLLSLKRFSLFSFLFLFFFLVPLGCSPHKKEIVIGINAELTGEVPAIGASCLHAAELFSAEANVKGGILINGERYPVNLAIIDNTAKADQALSATQLFLGKKDIIAMIGPNISSAAIPAALLAEEEGLLMISPWSTNPQTTKKLLIPGSKKYVFRASFTSENELPLLVQFARQKLHAKKAAILYDMSSQAPSTAAAIFEKLFVAQGGTIVAKETYTNNIRDFQPQLTKIRTTDPDIIFMPAYYHDVPLIAAQARSLGIRATFLGDDSWSSPAILELDNNHYLENSYFANHFSPLLKNAQANSFVTAYVKKYGSPPDDVAALTYDSLQLLKEALQKSSHLDRESVTQAMNKIQNYQGVTGKFLFKEGSHDPIKSFVILQVHQGAFTLKEVATP